MPPILKVDDISCRYGSESAVNHTSFDLEEGTLACLLGPSGCGKTTVLRAITGFQKLTGGSITLNDICISSTRINIPPEKRNISMVFQDYALFPHLTVEKNIEAGLFGKDPSSRKAAVEEMLRYVRLSDYSKRYPHELSGGQQQRVALARALAPKPGLLLMDEPFSNLDFELREKLGHEVRDLLKKIGTTCILVTHDQQDAFTFGDVVGVMNEGRIEQWGTPYNIYHQPETRFVANFVGDGVFLNGTLVSDGKIQCELSQYGERDLTGDVSDDRIQHDLQQIKPGSGKEVQVLIRPDDIIHDDDSPTTARIIKKAFRGESYLYTLALPSGTRVLTLVPSHHDHGVGESLGIKLDINHLIYFDR